jgi:hypothetical protein
MNRLVTYLESKEVVFHSALALIALYVPHAGHLFKQIEHIDMTIFGFTFMNWIYCIALATVIEILILVFIINGYQRAGKAYALVSFFINALYYDYWFVAFQEPSVLNIKLTATSFLICFMHSLAIWQLSDLFFKRVKADKEKVIEHWCSECGMGPFPSKRSLDGHISRAHKYRSLKNTNGQRKEQSGQKMVFQNMK